MNFYKNKPINCSGNDEVFTKLIDYISNLIKDCVDLNSSDDNSSMYLYSDMFVDILPEINQNLDQINFENWFIGPYSRELILILKKMIILWEEVQNELAVKNIPSLRRKDKYFDFSNELMIINNYFEKLLNKLF